MRYEASSGAQEGANGVYVACTAWIRHLTLREVRCTVGVWQRIRRMSKYEFVLSVEWWQRRSGRVTMQKTGAAVMMLSDNARPGPGCVPLAS